MGQVWLTSDLHLGHAKVLEEREPWAGADHDGFLAENWDAQVKQDDVVWVLGDISSGKTPDQWSALQWFSSRPGRKRLVLGNHDGPHPAHRDAHRWFKYYSVVFELVTSSARIRVPGGNALLSHFPYVGDHTTEDRYSQWRLRDEGLPIIHGHTHSQWVRAPWVHPRQLHVGVDCWHGLVPLSTVHTLAADIIEKGE